MTGELYGEREKSLPPKKAKAKKPKVEEPSGYRLRITLVGSVVDIDSVLPATDFVQQLQSTIAAQGANPNWLGWFSFDKPNGKPAILKVTNIQGVEEL